MSDGMSDGMNDVFTIDTTGQRDLAPLALDAAGRLRVLPASFWAATTREERAMFGVSRGFYSFPTDELVARLRQIIGGRRAIEVGAGHGALAQALGITATDSFQQQQYPIRRLMQAMGQPPVAYGPHVQKLDARAAIRELRPQVVIGCWVTHKYDPRRHGAGGNEAGLDEEWIVNHCECYVVVGNQSVHRHKSIWALPHYVEHPPYVYSRAMNGSPDFLAIWPGRHGPSVKESA